MPGDGACKRGVQSARLAAIGNGRYFWTQQGKDDAEMSAIWPLVMEAFDEAGDILVSWVRRIGSFFKRLKNG